MLGLLEQGDDLSKESDCQNTGFFFFWGPGEGEEVSLLICHIAFIQFPLLCPLINFELLYMLCVSGDWAS